MLLLNKLICASKTINFSISYKYIYQCNRKMAASCLAQYPVTYPGYKVEMIRTLTVQTAYTK